MKCIIAGTRTLTEKDTFEAIADCPWVDEITEVVSGGARGPDTHGERWARDVANLPVKRFPANWSKYGRAAGPIRNRHMARYVGDGGLIAVWDGRSRGTGNMIGLARDYNLRVHVWTVDNLA